MSKIISIELQNLPCPAVPSGSYNPEAEERNPGLFGQEPGLHLVAVLCEGPDGHRCYMAAYKMPDLSRMGEMNKETEELWEREKLKAATFAHRHGHLVKPEAVCLFFAVDHTQMRWAR